ncbi:MAG: hypothetical protein LAP40_18230 [Acidobacteriia bacterium]|nr:hypothetical protein [Terriglobia bacterium]
MNTIIKAGNAKTSGHRGKVTFPKPLKGLPSKYAFLATAASALLGQSGAHVISYDLDATNKNMKAFEVYTDEEIADFSWVVVQL